VNSSGESVMKRGYINMDCRTISRGSFVRHLGGFLPWLIVAQLAMLETVGDCSQREVDLRYLLRC
jgi:hypothetical protein